MAKVEVSDEIVRLLKLQRHDFINHLQVIHAMIQLGKAEKALRYIEELSKNPSALVSDQMAPYIETEQHKTGA